MGMIAEAVKHMLAAGMPMDTVVAAVAAMEGACVPARSTGADRTRRWRERNAAKVTSRDVTVTDVTVCDEALPLPEERKVSPCTPSKETQPSPSQPSASPQAISGRERDFARFWQAYPRRVGKDAALKAFLKAFERDRDLTIDRLLNAIAAYARNKPPDLDFCHPTTWLNQGRWNDEWTGNQGVNRRPQSAADTYLAAANELLGELGHGGRGEAGIPDGSHADLGGPRRHQLEDRRHPVGIGPGAF